MTNKYYHNDYKKMMGLDETRTASQKLLDKAIGGIKNVPEVNARPVQKKVKEENLNLSHLDVLNKLIKNIDNNKNAIKLIKPLNILKKCMNDQSFVSSPEINKFEQWSALSLLLMEADDKLVGNYSEVGLVIECLVEIFAALLPVLKKLKLQIDSQKQEDQKEVKLEQAGEIKSRTGLSEVIEICELHLTYLKLFTDDSFAFNKLLSEFKIKFYSYFQAELQGRSSSKQQLHDYIHKLLMKMFALPYAKYEWLKQSLAQFFKDFNISYKHALQQDRLNAYLKTYNEFLNQKTSKGQGESVNIFGTGGKGGKVATVQLGGVEGLDKWTSKQ